MPILKCRTQFPLALHILTSLASLLLRTCVVTSCEFPEPLRMAAADPPWISHVRASLGGSVEVPLHDSEYFIRHNVMQIHYPGLKERPHVRWKCSMAFDDKLLLKREDHNANTFYRCVRFYVRSPSVVQIAWSYENDEFDDALCAEDVLALDPWLLIRPETLHADHSKCPFSGGFDMKTIDSETGKNGCNLMKQPMRLEAECIGGEGVVFDYITSNCLPDVRMYARQHTLCVASWTDRENHYVVLRRDEDEDLWCLVMPVTRSIEAVTTAFLYKDLTCRQHPTTSSSTSLHPLFEQRPAKYLTLLLSVHLYPTVCEDEYSGCSDEKCNLLTRRTCRRSCKVCDAQTSFPPACNYPRRFQGHWKLQDINGASDIEISGSNFSVSNVGNFQCVTYPDSPDRKSRIFTTVSLYNNGCRPRFTCVKMRRLGPAVLSYSLSRSIVWPEPEKAHGERICDESLFQADHYPIDDLYRSHEKAAKPIFSSAPDAHAVPCNISNVMTISATLPDGNVCTGSLSKHCEDTTKLRLEFSSCGDLIPASSDYQCLANFMVKTYEKLVLIRNVQNFRDARCFIFHTKYSNEFYSLVAGQCDLMAFTFVKSSLRKPLLKVMYREEAESCRSVPTLAPTAPSTVSTRKATSQPQRLVNSHASMGDQSGRSDFGTGKESIPSSRIIEVESSGGRVSEQTYKEPESPTSLGGESRPHPENGRNCGWKNFAPRYAGLFALSLVVFHHLCSN
ncbi:hypothetical protein PoB_007075500 [Plakobranchus ocellatus]|uniref:DUF7042 domain-containing protein n=1 Tax=Plakobranchus ocellatus TaxID=259542 RepID=A0AAV4DJR0_9GAST|nr:hypothetical protein PoB_007075500 [Plakobranchus ocellatus]